MWISDIICKIEVISYHLKKQKIIGDHQIYGEFLISVISPFVLYECCSRL